MGRANSHQHDFLLNVGFESYPDGAWYTGYIDGETAKELYNDGKGGDNVFISKADWDRMVGEIGLANITLDKSLDYGAKLVFNHSSIKTVAGGSIAYDQSTGRVKISGDFSLNCCDLNNLDYSGSLLKIIQTVEVSDPNGNFRFVDGGINSPAFKQAEKKGLHTTDAIRERDASPYYLHTPTEIFSEFINGDLPFTDAPDAINHFENVSFTSMLVITDFNGSGRDLIVGHFLWGTTNRGNNLTQSQIVFRPGIPEQARSVIKQDYPNMKFFGED